MLIRPGPNVNVDEILALADYIEGLDERDFKMADCSRCVMGHQASRISGKMPCMSDGTSVVNAEQVMTSLGVSEAQFLKVFLPPIYGGYMGEPPTRGHAARMLRHLALTGEVDWKLTENEPQKESENEDAFDLTVMA